MLRQNHVANHTLFEAFESDFAMVPSEIVAHECLAILTTPLLAPSSTPCAGRRQLVAAAARQDVDRARFGWDVPMVWSVTLNIAQAPSAYRLLMRHDSLRLGQLLRARSPVDRPGMPRPAAPA